MKRAATLCLLTLAFAMAHSSASAQSGAGDAQRAADAERAQAELATLRQKIADLSEAQTVLAGERDDAARDLRAADRRIAEATTALRTLDADAAAQEAQLALLEQQASTLATRLDAQRAALARLLRALHAQGKHAPLKLLLAQDRIDALGRSLGYLGYFRRARVDRIESLLGDLADLAAARAAVVAQRAVLDEARAQQQAALVELDEEREQRRQLLATLNARFKDSGTRLAAMGRDEAALVALIARLQDIFGDIPTGMEGEAAFASLLGRLPWPLSGSVRTAFGRPLPDGRSSSGWLIDAQPGAEVRAVAHGRIAFSDWLKGFGLISIIDHGDGYMSLYASTDALLRAAGDWVKAGDVIALAGSSGGQTDAGVYFELRRNGKPIDPAGWLSRRAP